MLKPINLDSVTVNGLIVPLAKDGQKPLSHFLRDDLALRGTKIGCGTGDCGACTVIVNGEAVYACITPTGRTAGCEVITVEGVDTCTANGAALQDAFLSHQAVQCGFCIPGMLCAATAALDRDDVHSMEDARDSIAGVLCRCTGYQKQVAAIHDVAQGRVACRTDMPATGVAVGTAVTRLDGLAKVQGTDSFGADGIPIDALMIKAIRSPFHRARFAIGDLKSFVARHPGVERVILAEDVPGLNVHGVAQAYADQPVLAQHSARFLGEAVALIVGSAETIDHDDFGDFPIQWESQAPLLTIDDALSADAPLLHDARPDNILIHGRVVSGDVDAGLSMAAAVVEGHFQTSFVEHAYIEPEAGWARMDGDVIEVYSPTQAPHPHREELARILGCSEHKIRVIPSAVGGGFGGKLDLTVQPLVALATWILGKTVGMIFTREESISTSTKRHPATIDSRIAATADGTICAIDFHGDFNTGAYASWGTAVANRVPVHASGPYKVGHYRALTRAVHTNITPAGAFRGFGVPQAVVAQEQMIDELANRLGIDRLEFRLRNVLRAGDALVTGQVLPDSVGIEACLLALKPRWEAATAEACAANQSAAAKRLRRGVGIAAMIYGCGNTASTNPSTIRMGINRAGDVILHQGAVDAGQGSNTVIPQIAADAFGIPLQELKCVDAATHVTPSCGRTSASRQTFVTGKAALLAGQQLRAKVLNALGQEPSANVTLTFGNGFIASEGSKLDLSQLPANEFGYVMMAEATFDPPATPLDKDGQGSPYAVYAFGAQLAEVEVDTHTGTTRVLRVTAAHDVGRMVNPSLLEGQVEGAVAQGIGLALMEKFVPGVTLGFRDYPLPTSLDMPRVDTILVEEPASIGPYGAKGIGEPALVPTAAAILNAVSHAIGKRMYDVPATPEVILRALDAPPS